MEYKYQLDKFTYFYSSDKVGDAEFGLESIEINCKNQLLFSDLQLMLKSGYVSSLMWSEKVEVQMKELIHDMKLPQENYPVGLNDLYFTNTSNLSLQFVNRKSQLNEKHNIYKELDNFGRQMKKKNHIVIINQEGKYTLLQLVNVCLELMNKIFFCQPQRNYKDQIVKRYLIEYIIAIPPPSEKDSTLKCTSETEIYKIFQEYFNFLKNITIPIKGQFILQQIFGKQLTEVKWQLAFLQKLTQNSLEYDVAKRTKNLQERLSQLLIEPQQFKKQALDDLVQQFISNHQQLSQFNLQKIIISLSQDQFVQKFSNCSDDEFFTQLHIGEQLLTEFNSKYSKVKQNYQIISTQELQSYVSRTLNNILQQNKVQEDDAINFKALEAQLTGDLQKLLEAEFDYISCINSTSETHPLYEYIEQQFFQSTLYQKAEEICQFFTLDANLSRDKCKYLSLQIQSRLITLKQAIQQLFDYCNLLQNQIPETDLLVHQCLINQPTILKKHYVRSFLKGRQRTTQKIQQEEFKLYVIKQEQAGKFQPQLNKFKDLVQAQIDLYLENLNSEFQNPLIRQYISSSNIQIEGIKQQLLDTFNPWICFEEESNNLQVILQNCNHQQILKDNLNNLNLQLRDCEFFISALISQQNNIFQINISKLENGQQFQKNLCDLMCQTIAANYTMIRNKINGLFLSQKLQNEIDKQISEYVFSQIKLMLSVEYQEIQNKKNQQMIQAQSQLDTLSLIPFQCVEKFVQDIIYHQSQENLQQYLQSLIQYNNKLVVLIRQKDNFIEDSISLGLTQKRRDAWQQHIKSWMIEQFSELNIEIISTDELTELIINEMIEFYEYSPEKLHTALKDITNQYLQEYLNRLYIFTQEKCEQITTVQINLQEVKLEDQEIQDKINSFQFICQNKQGLKRQAYNFFKTSLLDDLGVQYQKQIEQELSKDQNIS